MTLIKHSCLRVFLLLVLAGLAVYANAIFHPFVHDDVVFIAQNPNIARWDNLFEAFFRTGVPFQSLQLTTPYYRPVLEVFYRAGFSLFGMNPAGFHCLNILLHILNAFLLYLVCLGLRLKRSWAFAVALVFLVHPVQSEAVACVSGISNLAVTVFCLGAFLSYLQARRFDGARAAGWSAGALILFVLALLPKEQAIIFPALVLTYEFFMPTGMSRPLTVSRCSW
ncbi:MAG: hypothetical protein HQL18_03300, partial [Candidatus Omnitrophica bacterium]|nr:hypothetical protein [Candidatus Omnitrophota bacterium]